MGFNITDFLNMESKKEIKSDWKPVKVSVKKLRPAPGKVNFYHADDKEIKDLAESIELVGLQQYPVIRPLPDSEEYEIIAGHKRRLAILRLLDEGKEEYEMIPCKVETSDDMSDEIKNELILIFTNSTQRERTDYEKMREVERVRQLLEQYQKIHGLSGRKQTIIAEILGTNKTKVGTLDNINKNLIDPFKALFAEGAISTSVANEIAGLDTQKQSELFALYSIKGSLTVRDVQEALSDVKKKKTENMPKKKEKEVSDGYMRSGGVLPQEEERPVFREEAESPKAEAYPPRAFSDPAKRLVKEEPVQEEVKKEPAGAAEALRELEKYRGWLTAEETKLLWDLVEAVKGRV